MLQARQREWIDLTPIPGAREVSVVEVLLVEPWGATSVDVTVPSTLMPAEDSVLMAGALRDWIRYAQALEALLKPPPDNE